MAYEIPGFSVTVPAGADLSTQQFRFVSLNASGQAVNPATTAMTVPFGVLQNKPNASGAAAQVMISGVSKLQMAASTLAAGDFVGASTAGQGFGGSTNGFYKAGIIMSGSSGAAGRIVTVLLHPFGVTT